MVEVKKTTENLREESRAPNPKIWTEEFPNTKQEQYPLDDVKWKKYISTILEFGVK
jgi:hypothetical protein